MKKEILLFLLLIFSTVVWYSQKEEISLSRSSGKKAITNQKQITDQEIDQLVNKHLYITGQKQDLHEQSEVATTELVAPKIGDRIFPQPKLPATKLDLKPDINESNVYEDLQSEKKDLQIYKPDYQIQSSLADQELQKRYEESYNEAFARQFVENARQNGYEIRLNEKYEVISVVPIRKPSSRILPVK